jgi:tetratricopeptide (TPR) repeat protein
MITRGPHLRTATRRAHAHKVSKLPDPRARQVKRQAKGASHIKRGRSVSHQVRLGISAVGNWRSASVGNSDRHSEGTALNNLGLALGQVRRFEEAITAHQDAAVIFRDADDRYGEGAPLNNLGLVLQELGRYGEAITAYQAPPHLPRDWGPSRRG